jgi:beta-glucosidase
MKGRTYRYTTDYLFPFGFGLSYTQFEIGNAMLSKTTIKPDDKVQLTIPVKNTGKRNGTEIVQVYVRKMNDVEGPLKTLRGFSRVDVPAGMTQQVTIDLPASAFEFYDWGQRQLAVTPGEYEVFYGNSSDPKDLKVTTLTISQ